MSFAYPAVLLLFVALVPLGMALLWTRRQSGGFGFASSRLLKGAHIAADVWLYLPALLRILLLASLIFATARPLLLDTKAKRSFEGLDIMLALDTSNSMLAMDFELNGKRQNRLEVVKHVVENFISGRAADRIGLVVFGSQAFTQAPLTLDHRVLLQFLQPIAIGMAGPETAIGDGLATAIKRLKDIEAPSRIVILLTDGSSNAGVVEPKAAVEIAKTLGIKIYTIGVGSNEPVPFPVQGFFGVEYRPQLFKMDKELLQFMAEQTGGRFFLASDTKTLENVYATIDTLEKTKVEADDPRPKTEIAYVFLLAALGFYLLEQALMASRWRVVP